jgi:hypothetical protein
VSRAPCYRAGSTIAVPLDEPAEYSITNETRNSAPYVAIGSKESNRLVNPLTVATVDGKAQLVSWDSSAPWGRDLDRLTSVATACESGPTLWLRTDAEGVHLRFGHCTVTVPPQTAPKMMAIMAGPYWTSVARTGGWPRANQARGVPLLICFLLAATAGALLSIGLGLGACVVCGGALVAAARWFPVAGFVGFALLLALAWGACTRKWLRARIRKRSVFAAVWLMVFALPFAALYAAIRETTRSGDA